MNTEERLRSVGITPFTPASEDFLRFQHMIFTILQARGFYLNETLFEELRYQERSRLFYMSHGLWEKLKEFEKA